MNCTIWTTCKQMNFYFQIGFTQFDRLCQQLFIRNISTLQLYLTNNKLSKCQAKFHNETLQKKFTLSHSLSFRKDQKHPFFYKILKLSLKAHLTLCLCNEHIIKVLGALSTFFTFSNFSI